MTPDGGRGPRSRAEWVSFALSCAVVLGVVGLIVAQIPGEDRPPDPVVRVERVRRVGSSFHVETVVENRGGATAAEVQVAAELVVGDGADAEVSGGDQVVAFLAPDERVELVFVFSDDPAAGDLEVVVTGFAVP